MWGKKKFSVFWFQQAKQLINTNDFFILFLFFAFLLPPPPLPTSSTVKYQSRRYCVKNNEDGDEQWDKLTVLAVHHYHYHYHQRHGKYSLFFFVTILNLEMFNVSVRVFLCLFWFANYCFHFLCCSIWILGVLICRIKFDLSIGTKIVEYID